ncbi:nucleotide exchange factor GrpE [Enterococcus sp. BWB1-3]|uniref:nucleotide exchange factor GrpE n=1 Tax=unclassified Enterococcus TaxID=2608891 RepID=UPI00192180BB|nr:MULTISPECIES: nucleotide exchange factor GrpE [unclassified Enterococcus]MBL1230751.1 nucleotide exchange factor GrpE [Enterococcus sp. BWB1-3]MCB5951061.1 nucleotide exchange factor GrpE [Enterococcus sp. BWT-B8]MCB5955109.1 nucleotide exchange factor GrpE [Enterococcus sp. CWB-B31]
MSKKEETQDEVQNPAEETETVAETVESTETELTETERLTAELSEMEDKFLRARAEIANMNSRFKNERELLVRYRSQDLGKAILPAMDNLERAMAIEVEDEQGASLKKGIFMVLENLTHALKEEGIEEIPAMGESFDPNLHQAVQTVPAEGDVQADTIVEVLQKGYKLHDRVLRASMVVVAQ